LSTTSDRATPLAAALVPCFIVCDHNGQALAFVRTSGKLFTRDKALTHRINIAKAVSPVAPLLL
jgi:hypothetical protein